MDAEEFEKLKKRVLAAEKGREEAEQREQKAEQQAQKAEQQAQKEKEARQKAEEELRKTTLPEYLSLCHEHLSESMSVQTDKSRSTKGDPSNADGKLRPDRIQPWLEFIDKQKGTLEMLYSIYPSDVMPQAFDSRNSIKTQGEKVALRKLASEQDLQSLQRAIVETPVAQIVAHLKELDDVRNEFGLAGGIEFYNHLSPLSNDADEVAQRLAAQQLEPSTPPPTGPSISHCRPDQVCVHTTVDDILKPTLIVEYKAPHKLTCAHLRHVLHPGSPPLELDKVINRVRVPSSKETDAYFEYHAERLVAAVITQTFSYMVDCGTQFGYITTGEAFVFLHFRLEENAKTVYYHLAEPNADVNAQKKDFPDTKDYLNRTAISQVLAFSLLALQSVQGTQEWREGVIEILKIWEVDFKAVLEELPETPENADKSSPWSEYHPKTYSINVPDRSPIRLRSRKTTCPDPDTQDDQNTPPPTDDESSPIDTPTRSQRGPRGNRGQRGQRGQRGLPNGTGSSSRGGQKRAFCTQLCLQGLARGGPLDRQCQNVSDHCEQGYQGDRHQLDGEEFRMLLSEQLRRSRGDACQPLGMEGARGALFRVILTSHGYTVVGKGTVPAFVKDIRHEAEVYRRLVTLQGVHVPICLGSIDLNKPYYYSTGIRIVHLMLLSWAGECLDGSKTTGTDGQRWTSDLVCAVNAIHGAGVLHQDIRMPNLLWNEEMKRVMLIDFERAEIVKTLRQALSPMSPNRKRKRALGAKEVKGEDNMLGIKSKDPKIRFQAALEESAMRSLLHQWSLLWPESTTQDSAGLGSIHVGG